MIKIKFYSLIRMHLGLNEIEINTNTVSVLDLLRLAEKMIGMKFIDQLIDEEMQILPGTMILINGRNIWHLDKLGSSVTDDDEISIFPPGGGG